MKPLLYITLDSGRELAVSLTTREEVDATHIAEREPTAEELIQAGRLLARHLATVHTIHTTPQLHPRIG